MRLQVALIGLLAIASPAASQAPEHLGRYEMAYPFPSPDGASLVFQGNFDGRWQLYVMKLEDGAMRRLHISERDDTHPAVSPDGKKLAFVSNRDGNDEVYVLDMASGAARSVAPHPGKDGHPKWSSDGAWIVFNRTFDPADTGGDRDSAIMRVGADGSGLKVIGDSPRVETFPSFSPDGGSVVFVEWFPNAAGERNRNGELVVADVATGARRQLTRSDGFDGYPFWGASGEWIYFSTPVTDGASGRFFAVHRIRPSGEGMERLTGAERGNALRAIPSRDETSLYFNSGANGRTLLNRQALSPPTVGP